MPQHVPPHCLNKVGLLIVRTPCPANLQQTSTAARHCTHVVQAISLPVAACCMYAGKGSSSGVGFAIPVDTVKGLVDQILQYGRVMRPSLGVVIAPPQALQRIGEEGVLVLDVSALSVGT